MDRAPPLRAGTVPPPLQPGRLERARTVRRACRAFKRAPTLPSDTTVSRDRAPPCKGEPIDCQRTLGRRRPRAAAARVPARHGAAHRAAHGVRDVLRPGHVRDRLAVGRRALGRGIRFVGAAPAPPRCERRARHDCVGGLRHRRQEVHVLRSVPGAAARRPDPPRTVAVWELGPPVVPDRRLPVVALGGPPRRARPRAQPVGVGRPAASAAHGRRCRLRVRHADRLPRVVRPDLPRGRVVGAVRGIVLARHGAAAAGRHHRRPPRAHPAVGRLRRHPAVARDLRAAARAVHAVHRPAGGAARLAHAGSRPGAARAGAGAGAGGGRHRCPAVVQRRAVRFAVGEHRLHPLLRAPGIARWRVQPASSPVLVVELFWVQCRDVLARAALLPQRTRAVRQRRAVFRLEGASDLTDPRVELAGGERAHRRRAPGPPPRPRMAPPRRRVFSAAEHHHRVVLLRDTAVCSGIPALARHCCWPSS